jgi:hypothetical protein
LDHAPKVGQHVWGRERGREGEGEGKGEDLRFPWRSRGKVDNLKDVVLRGNGKWEMAETVGVRAVSQKKRERGEGKGGERERRERE